VQVSDEFFCAIFPINEVRSVLIPSSFEEKAGSLEMVPAFITDFGLVLQ
jgi:hypothetical protein